MSMSTEISARRFGIAVVDEVMSMSTEISARRFGIAVVGLLLALVSTACGDATSTAGTDAPRSQEDPTPAEVREEDPTAAEVRAAFGTISYDLTPVEDVAELEATAELIVTGTLSQIVTGRVEGADTPDDPWAARNAALRLDVTSVTKGQAAIGDEVWVEVPVSPEALREIPEGLGITAYLSPAAESTADYPRLSEGSEVPPSATLWTAAHPQGLIFDVLVGGRPDEIEPLTGALHEVSE